MKILLISNKISLDIVNTNLKKYDLILVKGNNLITLHTKNQKHTPLLDSKIFSPLFAAKQEETIIDLKALTTEQAKILAEYTKNDIWNFANEVKDSVNTATHDAFLWLQKIYQNTTNAASKKNNQEKKASTTPEAAHETSTPIVNTKILPAPSAEKEVKKVEVHDIWDFAKKVQEKANTIAHTFSKSQNTHPTAKQTQQDKIKTNTPGMSNTSFNTTPIGQIMQKFLPKKETLQLQEKITAIQTTFTSEVIIKAFAACKTANEVSATKQNLATIRANLMRGWPENIAQDAAIKSALQKVDILTTIVSNEKILAIQTLNELRDILHNVSSLEVDVNKLKNITEKLEVITWETALLSAINVQKNKVEQLGSKSQAYHEAIQIINAKEKTITQLAQERVEAINQTTCARMLGEINTLQIQPTFEQQDKIINLNGNTCITDIITWQNNLLATLNTKMNAANALPENYKTTITAAINNKQSIINNLATEKLNQVGQAIATYVHDTIVPRVNTLILRRDLDTFATDKTSIQTLINDANLLIAQDKTTTVKSYLADTIQSFNQIIQTKENFLIRTLKKLTDMKFDSHAQHFAAAETNQTHLSESLYQAKRTLLASDGNNEKEALQTFKTSCKSAISLAHSQVSWELRIVMDQLLINLTSYLHSCRLTFWVPVYPTTARIDFANEVKQCDADIIPSVTA